LRSFRLRLYFDMPTQPFPSENTQIKPIKKLFSKNNVNCQDFP
jgi:hypothetical protein